MKYIYQLQVLYDFTVNITRIEVLTEFKSHYIVNIDDSVALWYKKDINLGTSHFETRKEAEDYVSVKIRDICNKRIKQNIRQIDQCRADINVVQTKLNELNNQQKE